MDNRLGTAARILSSLALDSYTRLQALARLQEIGYTEQEAIFVLGVLVPEPSRSTPQAMIEDTLPHRSPGEEDYRDCDPKAVITKVLNAIAGKDPSDAP